MDLIDRDAAIDALKAIKYGLWEIDIPSPSCPEYVEHHKQIKDMMEIVDGWMKKLMKLPSSQPTSVLCNELRISTLPKIVICKDCRFRIDGKCYVSNFKPGLPCMIRFVRENDFCSMAERREDE